MKSAARLALVVGILVLAGCGGGGGGGGSTPPPPPPSASTPSITAQPAPLTVANGAAASFSVTATANGTLSYSWRKDGATIAGANAATYSIASTSAASAGTYDVVVTNTLNGAASSTSNTATLTVIQGPSISNQPTPVAVLEGSVAVVLVTATAPGTLSYQWRKDGVAIAGATQASYVINAAYAADSGSYDVVVTNTQGGVAVPVTSNAVALSVLVQPVITAESAVVASSGNHAASIPAISPATYAWSIVNGTITGGQGTNQIAYTAGSIGDAQLSVTLSGLPLALSAVKRQRVVSLSPAATIFAPAVVHTMDFDIRASSSANSGYTFSFSTPSVGRIAELSSPSTQPWFYQSQNLTGSYSIDLAVTDSHGNSRTLSRTLSIANNVFLRHKRDPIPRSLHTATMLNDGRVLLVGGDGGVADFGTLVPEAGAQSRVLGSAEIFDPVTDNFADTASLSPRYGHTATLLNDGRVLVVGGASAANTYLGSATLYDPDTGTWSATGSLMTPRAMHTATLLANGRVLVTGGVDGSGALATSEIYDPASGTWSGSGSMNTARVLHAVARLADGRVLVGAGRNAGGLLASVEIFDPAAGTWSAAAPLSTARNGEGAVLLPSGKVIVLGNPVEMYDPTLNTWTSTLSPGPTPSAVISGSTATLAPDGSVVGSGDVFVSSAVERYSFSANRADLVAGGLLVGRNSTTTMLVDGRLLIVGGTHGSQVAVAAQHVANGTAVALNVAGSLSNSLGSNGHRGAGAVVGRLQNGLILYAGGADSRVPSSTVATVRATAFDPANNNFLQIGDMPTARVYAASTVLTNGRMLVAGGTDGFTGVRASADYYDPNGNAWSNAGSMSVARYRHTVSGLPGGAAIAVGGRNATSCNCTTFLSSVDRYDSTTHTWSPANPLITARDSHTATTLADGRILVVGGYGGAQNSLADTGTALASAEIFDPATGNWTATGSLNTARRDHVAILLGNGRVLVAGGSNGATTLSSAEIYDVNTGVWTPAATMNTARQSANIALLADGRVLVANGLNGASSAVFGTATGEVYDPVANTWSTPVPVQVPRVGGLAVSLADGRVLIVGGLPNYAGAPEFYR